MPGMGGLDGCGRQYRVLGMGWGAWEWNEVGLLGMEWGAFAGRHPFGMGPLQ